MSRRVFAAVEGAGNNAVSRVPFVQAGDTPSVCVRLWLRAQRFGSDLAFSVVQDGGQALQRWHAVLLADTALPMAADG